MTAQANGLGMVDHLSVGAKPGWRFTLVVTACNAKKGFIRELRT